MTTSMPAPRPGIMDIAPYKGGESDLEGQARIIKLSSNEAPSHSPKAAAACVSVSADHNRYPDGGANALRKALAEHNNIDVDRIVCGAGSDELISLLCNAYAGPGDEVLHTEHGFLMYAISAKAAGATPVAAKESNLTTDVDALLDCVTKRTKIVFLANPNNPTGTLISQSKVERLWQGLPKHIVLVLDAAYAEFVEDDDYQPGHAMVDASDNVVMLRTFSKIYGLGGLRLGWGYAPAAIAEVLNRVRGPFNISTTAQAVGLAALLDTDFTEQVRKETIEIREWTADQLHDLGVTTTESVGNFVLMCLNEGTNRSAVDCDAFLKASGIIVRPVAGYGLPDWLRVTIGTKDEMQAFIDAMMQFLAKAD
ncbi:MAG: histidinol-phosphate transaminase [Rhodospirillales bacterium]|nr:histidinol-phosphate transaminase [Rhodospirillales bacterium]